MQCLAFDFQNTLQQNSSVDKNCTNHTSNALRVNEQITILIRYLFKNCIHIPVQFDNNQLSTARKV